MILSAIVSAAALYFAATLLTGRRIYAHLRAWDIRTYGVEKYELMDALMYAAAALGCGLIWPLTLVMAAIAYKPAKTPEELKAERKAQAKYIRELEAELDAHLRPPVPGKKENPS
ncbi:MAG TPA: hypothetical protein VFU74_21810 [Actinocrinis sp.]|nr:hypothetical protein [Actinocrinis sp.]